MSVPDFSGAKVNGRESVMIELPWSVWLGLIVLAVLVVGAMWFSNTKTVAAVDANTTAIELNTEAVEDVEGEVKGLRRDQSQLRERVGILEDWRDRSD
jgi:hypothetical protein